MNLSLYSTFIRRGMSAVIVMVAFVFIFSTIGVQSVFACPIGVSCSPACENVAVGQCSASGYTCILNDFGGTSTLVESSTTCGGGSGQSVFGGVYVPVGVKQYQTGGAGIGIVGFASVLLRIFTIICGLWFMFNMFIAGYLFLSGSSDTGTFNKFKEMLYWSLIGLLVLGVAYLAAGLIGVVFFGDAGYIIRPTLFSATMLQAKLSTPQAP